MTATVPDFVRELIDDEKATHMAEAMMEGARPTFEHDLPNNITVLAAFARVVAFWLAEVYSDGEDPKAVLATAMAALNTFIAEELEAQL